MYTDDEIQRALQEIAALSPEEYLDLYAAAIAAEEHMPEMPNQLSFKAIDSDGFDYIFLIRDISEDLMMVRLAKLKETLKNQGFSPLQATSQTRDRPPASPTPAQAPAPLAQAPSAMPAAQHAQPEHQQTYVPDTDNPENIEVFTVANVKHVVTPNGKHCLNVKGGRWMLHGWTAWPENVPKSVNWMDWPIGTEYAPPESMALAWLDKAKRKIIQFAPDNT